MLLKSTFLVLLDEAKRLWERKNFVNFSADSVLLFLSPSSQSIHQVHKINIFKMLCFSKPGSFTLFYFVKPVIFFQIILYPELKLFSLLMKKKIKCCLWFKNSFFNNDVDSYNQYKISKNGFKSFSIDFFWKLKSNHNSYYR